MWADTCCSVNKPDVRTEAFQIERARAGSVFSVCLLLSRGWIAGSRSSVGTVPSLLPLGITG